jgi:hypothetical protein
MKDQDAHIYLIRQAGSDFYKIGIAQSPQKRLADLQVASPQELVLIYCTSCEWLDSCKIESAIHQKFSKKHIRGEWFCLSEEDVPAVMSMMDCYIPAEDQKRFDGIVEWLLPRAVRAGYDILINHQTKQAKFVNNREKYNGIQKGAVG